MWHDQGMDTPRQEWRGLRCLACGGRIEPGSWVTGPNCLPEHFGGCPSQVWPHHPNTTAEMMALELAVRHVQDIGQAQPDPLERAIMDTSTPLEELIALAEQRAQVTTP